MGSVSEWWRLFLRVLAGTLFVVYCFWQIFWLVQGKLAPALFRAATGIPAPTTGGTRSLIQLCQGDWRASLSWNPMAVGTAKPNKAGADYLANFVEQAKKSGLVASLIEKHKVKGLSVAPPSTP